MPTKAKLSAIRAGLAKVQAADPRHAVSAWWVAVWNLEATVDAVEQRLRELGHRPPMMHPALVVLMKEADLSGTATDPSVVDAVRGFKRALSMVQAADKYEFGYEDRRAAKLAVEDAANVALGIVLDIWCPWPGKLPPAPPLTARPAPVLPEWVGAITNTELVTMTCEMTASELNEWVNETQGGEGST